MYHETILTVRYVETDKFGIAHHSNHIIWFEVARTSLLRDIGLPYSEMEAQGVSCPLLETYCRYGHPARFEDRLIVRTSIAEMSPVKIRFSYEIVEAEQGYTVACGQTLHAFVDAASGRPVRLNRFRPEMWGELVQRSRPYFAGIGGQ